MGFNIMMSWKLLIVLVLFTIALGNVNGQKAEEEAEKVEQGKEKEQEAQKEKEEQAQKEKEAQKLKEQEAQKEKEAQKNTGCCKEDLLVTCDGTNTGLKKEGSTEAEKENACADYPSYTAQK